MSAALIIRNDARLSVSFTDEAFALRGNALERAAVIGRVSDARSQEIAVQIQKEIAELVNSAEKARKECKEPVLTYGRAIDDKAREFISELKTEQIRIAQLVADFQQAEQARVRAAQQAENERLTKLERERAAELAKAKDVDAIDKVQEKFNERARVEAPPVEAVTPTRANGQRVREEWEITVTDLWTLARAHPSCVTISPRLTEIKDLLDAGVKVAGVSAKKAIKASVTAGRSLKTIDV